MMRGSHVAAGTRVVAFPLLKVPLTPRPWSLRDIYPVSGKFALAPKPRTTIDEPTSVDFATQTAELENWFKTAGLADPR